MSQSHSMKELPAKKLITRSVATGNQLNTQTVSRQKLQPYNSLATSSVNTSQNARQKSFTKQQQKPFTKQQNGKMGNNAKSQQKGQKNMFYSELHIETHDADVPLVRILKLNQDLLKKFIQYSSSLESLMRTGRLRSLHLGLRSMASHFIQSEKYRIKVTKLKETLGKLLRCRFQAGMGKMFAVRIKFKIKQKAAVVLGRLIIAKIHSLYRHFLKNMHQKKLMTIFMGKADEDELAKMKINLEIFRQVTFSKDFVLKCRPLIKYNANNKGLFEKELLKANFEDALKLQLERYEQIRHNVDSRNPNQVESQDNKKVLVKKKPVGSVTSENQLYQNQVILMAIKSFNMFLGSTKLGYEQKITQLNEQITELQQEERYVKIQELLGLSEVASKAYEGAISEVHLKGDEEIRKVMGQFPLEKDSQISIKKLLPIVQAQKNKYLKSIQRHQKLFTTQGKSLDDYLFKFYKSRCFSLQICQQLLNLQSNAQPQIYKQAYSFITAHVEDLIEFCMNQGKIREFINRVKKSNYEVGIQQQASIVVGKLFQCLIEIHASYQIERQKYMEGGNVKEEQTKLSLNGQKQTSKVSLSKDKGLSASKQRQISKQRQASTHKIQRKTTNNLSASKQQSTKKQHPIPEPKLTKSIEATQPKPQQSSPQAFAYTMLMGMIRLGIIEHMKLNNHQYLHSKRLAVENSLIKRNLLPENKGRVKIEQNVEVNRFLEEVDAELQVLLKNFAQAIDAANQVQSQSREIIEMVSVFYEVILSSSKLQSSTNSNIKNSTQTTKKWTQLCKSKASSSDSLSLINTFNQILMLFKQLTPKQSKPNDSFSEQLKKILKEKLQFERLYNQVERKLLIKEEEYRIVEKQVKEYMKKQAETEKELNKMRTQARSYQQNAQNHLQNVARLKEELDVYVATAKTQAQENNKLNRQLTKTKQYLASVSEELQRAKLKESQRIKLTSQKTSITTTSTKTTYSLSEYTQMQANCKLRLTQLEETATQAQNSKFELNKLVIEFKSQIKDLERQNDSTRFELHTLGQELQKSKHAINELTEIEAAYQKQIERLEEERDGLRKSLNQIKDKLEVHKRDKLLVDRQEYSRLKEVEASSNDLEDCVQGLNAQIGKLSKKIRELEGQVSDRNSKMAGLQTELRVSSSKLYLQHGQDLRKFRLVYQEQMSQKDQMITQLEQIIKNHEALHQSAIHEIQTKYQKLTHNMSNNIHTHSLHNIHNTSSTHTHSHEVTVLEYDPERQKKSLRQFIQTLQRENDRLQTKYNRLKKQVYSDETSTQFSHKSTSSNIHSRDFYQSLLKDLKAQNDRLYGEMLKAKSGSTSAVSMQVLSNQCSNEDIVSEFWLKQVHSKQQRINQLENSINELRAKLQESHESKETLKNQFIYEQTTIMSKQLLRVHELELQLNDRNAHYTRIQQELRHRIVQLTDQLGSVQCQRFFYKAQVAQLSQLQEEESAKVHMDYTQLLLSTKQVKELFTSFIEATNAILYKLDRTSQIYLNFETTLNQRRSSLINSNADQLQDCRENAAWEQAVKLQQEQQAQKASQSIISLVEEFKTVIENNHETLKSIYENLVCHPCTKTALELHYLKELTFTIIAKFSHIRVGTDMVPLNYGREQLAAEIENIFSNQQQTIKPIEEVFVQVEELIANKISASLDVYRQQLHLKALELDHIRQRLNLVVDHSLINERAIITQLPQPTSSNHPYQQHSPHINYRYKANNQYQARPNYEQPYEQDKKDSINQSDQKIDQIQTISKERRPFSGNWVSKTTSNYEYRPLTSLIDKYDLMEEKITEHRDVMYRSYVNPFQPQNKQFASGRFS